MAKFKPYFTEQGELIPTYLGEWVTEQHLARLVNDIVEQMDLSEITADYSLRGEEAYHPSLLLKLWFYGYATGVFTSRKIRQALDETIPFRWLSGGQRPDFRTLSDFRKDHLPALKSLFRQIVQIAMEMGYVSLGHVSIDGSKVKANASKHKAMSREHMEQGIQRLEQELDQALAKTEAEESQGEPPEAAPADIEDQQARLARIREALQELEARQPEATSKTPKKDQINFTDSESRIMITKNQGVIQAYNPQIAVDEEHHFIVGLEMSHSSNDQKQFAPVLDSIQANTGKAPETVTADTGYFSADNIQAAEETRTDAYIAPAREGKKAKNPYDKTNFAYDIKTDTYTCPAGQVLQLKATQRVKDPDKPTRWVYEGQACPTCPFAGTCVKSKSGKRTLTRTEDDPIREQMRTKVQSDEGQRIYSKRKGIVEPSWGEIKSVQGFRQFHLRGEKKVAGEMTLLAISYNLRKIHAAKYPKKDTLYKREKSAQRRKKAA
jgi:Transposase and inactivated derivatives